MMTDIQTPRDNASRASRLKVGSALALAAALYVLVQHTSVAPFPHKADDFIGGFGVGTAIAILIGWMSARR